MAALADVMAYMCENTKHKEHLSVERLRNLSYLVDWRSALTRGRQVTRVVWTTTPACYPHTGDVAATIRSDTRFHRTLKDRVSEPFGDPSAVSVLDFDPVLNAEEREVCQHVLEHTDPDGDMEVTRIIVSTYPCLKRIREDVLDLCALAVEREKELRAIG